MPRLFPGASDHDFDDLGRGERIPSLTKAGVRGAGSQGRAPRRFTTPQGTGGTPDLGTTNFGLDYTRSNNNPTPSDHGFSVGGAIVQNVTDVGTQLYTQVRLFDLSSDPNTDSIWVGTTGMRIKF